MAVRVDYDQIATTYDARYTSGLYDGVLEVVRDLVAAQKPEAVLEVGCGTGYWLAAVRATGARVYGLDYSLEMLRRARSRSAARLVRATARLLPFRCETFDLILCVNAIHHFERVDAFLAQARQLLRPSGILAVIGMDPHHGLDQWCVYDYFPETKQTDLARYPSSGQIVDLMLQNGFARVECRVACRFAQTRHGRDVFDDPELQRRGCSQMALLTDEQYATGMERIEAALRRSPGESPEFKVDIAMIMQCAQVQDRG
jgi:ubiquinone/menaquinone biosynthesis C-methylase UbiE